MSRPRIFDELRVGSVFTGDVNGMPHLVVKIFPERRSVIAICLGEGSWTIFDDMNERSEFAGLFGYVVAR